MLGSPNGPAYGTRPKLVVMKVLCKLRWRKIRNLLIFPHSVFIPSLYSSLCLSLPFPFLLSSLSHFDEVYLFLCLPPSHPLLSLPSIHSLYLFSLSSCRSFSPSLFMLSGLFSFPPPLSISLSFLCPPLALPLYQN